MSAYMRLVAKWRRVGERIAETIPPEVADEVATVLQPHTRVAIAAVERLATHPAWQRAYGGELTVLSGQAAIRHAREITARTLAAIELAGARTCPHLDLDSLLATPQGVHSFVLLGYRCVACRACARAMADAGEEPDPADADRCDWCGMREVITFYPLVLPMGPSVVVGDACTACFRALVPGSLVQPKGRG
jgi:hypothetical protein